MFSNRTIFDYCAKYFIKKDTQRRNIVKKYPQWRNVVITVCDGGDKKVFGVFSKSEGHHKQESLQR